MKELMYKIRKMRLVRHMHTHTRSHARNTQMDLFWTVFRTSFQVSRLCLSNKASIRLAVQYTVNLHAEVYT